MLNLSERANRGEKGWGTEKEKTHRTRKISNLRRIPESGLLNSHVGEETGKGRRAILKQGRSERAINSVGGCMKPSMKCGACSLYGKQEKRKRVPKKNVAQRL